MARTRLCALADIPDGNSASVSIPDGPYRMPLVVVRRGEQVWVYRDRCPHEGDMMAHAPGKFLDDEAQYILCATHWAVFRIEDGACVHGPCFGDRLEAFAVSVESGEVFIDA